METVIKSYYIGTPLLIGVTDGDDTVNVGLNKILPSGFRRNEFISAIEEVLDGKFVPNGLPVAVDPTPEFDITRGPYGDIFVDGHGTYDGEITIEEAEKEIPVSKAILEFLKNEEKEKTTEEGAIEDLAYALAPGFSMNPIAVAAKFPEARRLYDLGVRAPKRET